jgi:hypothetical protein
MTEDEWQVFDDPEVMAEYLRGKTSERKARLFAVACCRRIWDRVIDPSSRQAVEVAERIAEGQASDEERSSAWFAAVARRLNPNTEVERAILFALFSTMFPEGMMRPVLVAGRIEHVESCSAGAVADYAARAAGGGSVRPDESRIARERSAQCDLLRCIAGPLPFRAVDLTSSWLTWNHGTVPAIARRVYDERAFHDLPILADALEDAGCADADILDHCRRPGEHVRGCWVIDLLLGKE